MADPIAPEWVPVFGDPCGPWIKTFAYLPRWTYDAGWIWLRPVWKQHIAKHYYLNGGSDFWWRWRAYG